MMDDSGRGALFAPLSLGAVTLKNRVMRSATYEGMGDARGMPGMALAALYRALAEGGVGAIVTGFAFVSQQGRAMQPRQCGVDDEEKAEAWGRIVEAAACARERVKLFMQIAHTGRQTLAAVTGARVVGASRRRSPYFRQRVAALTEDEVYGVVGQFARAAWRAKQAGFDGVQIHAAHGYLIHQFLSRATNRRRDRWGARNAFLMAVVDAVRARCGSEFAVLVKLSAADDDRRGVTVGQTIETAGKLAQGGVDAIEVSYGTMGDALNIMRGACPLGRVFEVNPLFRDMPPVKRALWRVFAGRVAMLRLKPFEENYNVAAAARIRRAVAVPVFAVGGVRSVAGMVEAVTRQGLDGVSMSRPLVCEPSLPREIHAGRRERSRCTNCNLCTVHADADSGVTCYREGVER